MHQPNQWMWEQLRQEVEQRADQDQQELSPQLLHKLKYIAVGIQESISPKDAQDILTILGE